MRAFVTLDPKLEGQRSMVWLAASWWNSALGCEVFSVRPGDRDPLVVVRMPWQDDRLADARRVGRGGLVRVFDPMELPLQQQIYRHELGHVLGLPNTDVEGDLMYGVAFHGTWRYHQPSYTWSTTVPNRTLTALRLQHCPANAQPNQHSRGSGQDGHAGPTHR